MTTEQPASLADYLRELEAERPSFTYQPGSVTRYPNPRDRFQLEFHKSVHVVRCLVPGNGAGKTTTTGVEVDYWVQHNHPYQDTPTGAVQVIWVCQKFQQMDLLREQLERRCFSRGWCWNENKHRYEWPSGDSVTVISNDGDWSSIQGVNPDLVVIDEECDDRLWTELKMRRRGDRKTRFVISATATKGKRWMYKEVYKPWLDLHVAAGMTEDQATRAQLDPYNWVWPKGGILDNPACDETDQAWYVAALAHASPQEREVRMRGGFVDLNQSPVFDAQALDEIEQRMVSEGIAGEQGILDEPQGPAVHPPHAVVPYKGGFVKYGDLMANRRRFEFLETGGDWEGGRLTIYEHPTSDGVYVIGADFAQGLQTGDFDAAIVCQADPDGSLVQVAELHGRFGQTKMPMLLYMLGFYFNEALIVGEANSMGLGNLRWLYEAGYSYQYLREQKPDAQATPKTDRLGYWKGNSLPVDYLKRTIAQRTVTPGTQGSPTPVVTRQRSRLVVRSTHALQELRKYSYRPRTKTGELATTPDEDLVMAAEAGYHDDLVSALAGCVMGWRELPRFDKPKQAYPAGSMGEKLGHEEVWRPKQQGKAFAFAREVSYAAGRVDGRRE